MTLMATSLGSLGAKDFTLGLLTRSQVDRAKRVQNLPIEVDAPHHLQKTSDFSEVREVMRLH